MSVILASDFESGDYSEFTGSHQYSGTRGSVASDSGNTHSPSNNKTEAESTPIVGPGLTRSKYARFIVAPGDSPFGHNESNEIIEGVSFVSGHLVIGYTMRLEDPWVGGNSTWDIVLQTYTSDFPFFLGAPPLALDVSPGFFALNLLSGAYNGKSSGYAYNKPGYLQPPLAPLAPGKLHQWIFDQGLDKTNGSVEVYHRLEGEESYAKVFSALGIPTLRYMDGHNGGAPDPIGAIKIGLYRDQKAGENNVTNVVDIEALVYGTDLASVEAALGGAGKPPVLPPPIIVPPAAYTVDDALPTAAHGTITWIATPSDVAATAKVEFFVDGALEMGRAETTAPYGVTNIAGASSDLGQFDTTQLVEGSRAFETRATKTDGTVASKKTAVMVHNQVDPPPTPDPPPVVVPPTPAPDFSAALPYIAKFRKTSPNVARAFDEVIRALS